jgi:hypothetical protein
MSERLEEIKSRVWKESCTYAVGDDSSREGYRYILADEDYHWLMEQAEKVEELELEINDWRSEVQKWQQFYKESEESHSETKELLHSTISEIKRYKQALEFYADEEHYKEKLISEAQYDADGICISNDEYAPPIIYFDSGEKARQALEGDDD